MRKKLRTKKGIAVLVAVLALAIAGGAFAYYLAEGTGSNNGTVAHGATATTIPVVVTVGDGSNGPAMEPGAQITFSGQVTNTSSQHASIDTLDPDTSFGPGGISTDMPTCDASWFTVSNLAYNDSLPVELATSSSEGFTGTLTFTNADVNQNGCQGAVISVGVVAG